MDTLVTICGTGTNYVMSQREVLQIHCCDPRLEDDQSNWITTYRDPYLVGATWSNRMEPKEMARSWFEQWDYYANQVLPRVIEIIRVDEFTGPVVKRTPGDKGARRAYADGDMELYHTFVPKPMIDYALGLTTDLRISI